MPGPVGVVTDLLSSGCDELSRQGATPREWGRISCSVYESFRKIPRCATFLIADRRLPLPLDGGSPASRTSLPLPPVARFAQVGPTGRLWTGHPVGFRNRFWRAIEASPGNSAARSRPPPRGPAGKKRHCRPAAGGAAKSCRPAIPTAPLFAERPERGEKCSPARPVRPVLLNSGCLWPPAGGPHAGASTQARAPHSLSASRNAAAKFSGNGDDTRTSSPVTGFGNRRPAACRNWRFRPYIWWPP